jgi:hypothetical protein
MTNNKLWLYEWLDIHEVHSLTDAKKLLRNLAPRKELRERVSQVGSDLEEIPISDAPTIVAGRAIDLSGELDCFHWDCVKKQVDKLFSHVWHYFDRIVIVGPDAHYISGMWDTENESQAIELLLTYIRLLLYLREIGAEDLLLFRQKPHVCEVHLTEDLSKLGMQPDLTHAEKIIEELEVKATIKTEAHEDHLHYTFNHPEFKHTVWGVVDGIDTGSGADLRHEVTTAVCKRYVAHLASDIWTANTLKAPLGSAVNLHGQLLKAFEAGVGEADVAFQLNLPILKGIKAEELLKIRRDEKLHFEKFRQCLRTAIGERLENSSNEKAEVIAAEITNDLIKPSLNDIERRLAGAKQVLAKKAGLSITLGGLATTCGLLTANPLLITTGVTTAVGGALNAEYKFIEEQRDITLSDMYFLWQAQKHGTKHKVS